MKTTQVVTRGKEQVVDLTELVEDYLRDAQQPDGVCVVFAAHTTCALTTADLDPGTDLDLLQALRSMLPRQTYRHPHDPSHAPDHILSSLIELDGPRQRTIHLATMG